MKHWERLDRRTLVDTSFLKVYSDKIRLPNGGLIDDYTVIKKRDIVMVVATDNGGNVIAFKEYKYAADADMLTLPAGQIDEGETPMRAAKRELLEETGYGGGTYEVVDVHHEYPTKDLHTVTVVRAKNVQQQQQTKHEATEDIGTLQLIAPGELRTQIQNKKWKSSSAIAALIVALPELFVE